LEERFDLTKALVVVGVTKGGVEVVVLNRKLDVVYIYLIRV
jgi:hypothetical protein